jgi:uncharacterized lipoprotein YajG
MIARSTKVLTVLAGVALIAACTVPAQTTSTQGTASTDNTSANAAANAATNTPQD